MINDDSLESFAKDLLLRTFDTKELIIEKFYELDKEAQQDFLQLTSDKLASIKNIYIKILETINKNIFINTEGGFKNPDKVTYHERFGWVVNIGNDKAFLGKLSILENTVLKIGRRSYISGPAIVRGGSTFEIGSYCSIAEGLYVNTSRDFHPMEYPSTVNFCENRRLIEDGLSMPIEYSEFEGIKHNVILGNDVWLGRNVQLSFGSIIGDGCIIGEKSLVRGDCEPYGIYAGAPAKLIRFRFPESIREQLIETQWWKWSYEKIKRNQSFFSTQLTNYDGQISDIVEN